MGPETLAKDVASWRGAGLEGERESNRESDRVKDSEGGGGGRRECGRQEGGEGGRERRE